MRPSRFRGFPPALAAILVLNAILGCAAVSIAQSVPAGSFREAFVAWDRGKLPHGVPDSSVWRASTDPDWTLEAAQSQSASTAEQQMQDLETRFDTRVEGLDSAWQAYVKAREHAWQEYMRSVEEKWGTFRGSTKAEWVTYSEDREARAYVNFRDGFIALDVLVPASDANPRAAAEQKAEAQIRQILAEKDVAGTPILEDQIPAASGGAASAKAAAGEVQPTIHKEILAQPERTAGADSVPRRRFTVIVPLVPDHLQRRAEKYLPIANRFAAQFGINPDLVMAVIHTESFFNPRAQSAADAHGLMQIVPRFAGRDTERELYGRDRIPAPNELYDPEENIKRGCCYLQLLYRREYGSVVRGDRRDYLVVSAYNCGPGRVRRNVLLPFDPLNARTAEDILTLCQRHLPRETAGYLSKVLARRKLYIEAAVRVGVEPVPAGER